MDSHAELEENIGRAIRAAREPFQLVYLTNDPDKLTRSLESFVRHYDADRAIVCCPRSTHDAMSAALGASPVSGTILHDEDICPGIGEVSDHSTRNFELRRALIENCELESLFVMLDDDCILLRKLEPDHFIRDGRIVARYSHGPLSSWRINGASQPTSFDRAQWNTSDLLLSGNFGELGFAAHQAQLFERESARAIFGEAAKSEIRPLDEWSVYFNIALARFAGCFEARRTTSLFWPERYAAWLPDWFDEDIRFENRYDALYRPDGLFSRAGIDENTDWRIKANFCKAGYATHLALSHLNELSAGETPVLRVADEVRGNAGQLFGFPGIVLGLRVDSPGTDNVPVEYVITKGGTPVAESASPAQPVGNNRNLAIRMPDHVGEYLLTIATAKSKPTTLPLFVLPYPVGGNY